MKKFFIWVAMLGMVSLLNVACSTDDDYLDTLDQTGQDAGGESGGSSSGTSTSLSGGNGTSTYGEAYNFTVNFDKSALEESVTVDSSDDDFIENTSFDKTITVTFSDGGTASVSGDDDNIVSVSGNDVIVNNKGSDKILYVLKGSTSNGFFKIYGAKKQGIKLSGVSITNPDGAAINNQNKKRTFVVLEDGTENYLADGTTYGDKTDDEDMKGTFFSEAQLIFSGKGYLEVDANCKAGISSDDYIRFMPGVNIYVDASDGNGIRGKDAITVTGGVVNVNITGTANKGFSSDGVVQFDGGRTTLITNGEYEWDDDDNDYSACAGVKADSLFRMNGGELLCKSSGTGGKGISCDDVVEINGGSISIITTGKKYSKGSASVSPKGIKGDGNMVIKGGKVLVRATGGEGSEGIESKGTLTISGGTVACWCYDDGINSADELIISGGYVYSHSTNNDGIDSNKNLTIGGGVVIAEGSYAPEVGLDAAEGYNIYIHGGTVVALGGSVAETSSTSKQASVALSVSANTDIAVFSGSTALMSYKVPSGKSTALMLSYPLFKSGSSYTVKSGVTISGGTDFYGLSTDASVSGGSGSATVTAAASVGSSMGGGMPGGGMPGSGGGRR